MRPRDVLRAKVGAPSFHNEPPNLQTFIVAIGF